MMRGTIFMRGDSMPLSIIVIFGLLCFLCSLNFSHAYGEVHSPYLILHAVAGEGQFLRENLTIKENKKLLGRSVMIGTLGGIDVILAELGGGLTNAAMSSQRLIDEFQPGGIILTGAAGALDIQLQISDIVICERWTTHDAGVFGAKGFQPLPIIAYSAESGRVVEAPHFSVNKALFKRVQNLREEEIPFEKIGGRVPKLILGGTGVSGNGFIDSQEKRVWLQKNFQALVVDCETAAVAQVCSANGIPFLAIRSASDLAGGSRSESAWEEMKKFFMTAAKNSSILVMELLKDLQINEKEKILLPKADVKL